MKLKALMEQLRKNKLDGYMVPSRDEFLGEYTPPHLARLEWLTGFDGSNGLAIITQNKAALITDGRYTTIAKIQLGKAFDVLDSWSGAWFTGNLNKKIVGYDPMLFSHREIKNLKVQADSCGFKLKCIEKNLVDVLWKRADSIKTEVFFLEKKYAGLESTKKIDAICEDIKGADYLLLTNPDSICWLLNMRGNDLPYTPLVLCYAFISRDGSFKIFRKNELLEAKKYFLSLIKRKKKIQADETKTPNWFFENGSDLVIAKKDPIELMKAIKNKVELEGISAAHKEDGIAVTKFLKWLEKNVGKVDEVQAADKLLEFRKRSPNFVSPSFESISAYGSNGAIIHYKPTKATSKVIKKDNLYLIDSGGQYYNGTTDVTRTVCFGKPTKEQIRNFTLVLKGHITIATIKFPIGTNGGQLDVLARQYLWQHGLDYKHGTGHGVGHFLSVHEGPQRIGTAASSQELVEGMILSNEPGYYKVGEYGIRIENLVEVVKSKYKGFLEFRTLTQVPIDMKLVDKKLLTKEELKWLVKNNASL